ncbi:LysR family transcriptional regulator [Xanthobacter sp. TB0136]|uniref:LysR family transcriptional regulator n=1 Tax=Xanthobacter sp. TB0136 TaxID=3459177 RepID=UPI004039AAD8
MTNFAWDDLQFFLAVARAGQLSRAARQLRTSHVTVSRRVDRLEQSLKLRLFERNPRGYELTSHGRRLLASAERIEAETRRLEESISGDAQIQRGIVRIAMPEGFASFFTTGLLVRFATQFPNLQPELVALPQITSLSRRETDISVTLDPIRASPYHHEKLSDYTLRVYGAREYLARHPPITDREMLPGHRFIGYIEEMIFSSGLDYLEEVHSAVRAQIKCSSLFNQLSAVRDGLGLGVLPSYMARRYDDLVEVLGADLQIHRSYWLNCHRDNIQSPRERAVMAFLRDGMARLGHLLVAA